MQGKASPTRPSDRADSSGDASISSAHIVRPEGGADTASNAFARRLEGGSENRHTFYFPRLTNHGLRILFGMSLKLYDRSTNEGPNCVRRGFPDL